MPEEGTYWFTVQLMPRIFPAGVDPAAFYKVSRPDYDMEYLGRITNLAWNGKELRGDFAPTTPMGQEFAQQLLNGEALVRESPQPNPDGTIGVEILFKPPADLALQEELAGRWPRQYVGIKVWRKQRCLEVHDEEEPIHVCQELVTVHQEQANDPERVVMHRCHCGIKWSAHVPMEHPIAKIVRSLEKSRGGNGG